MRALGAFDRPHKVMDRWPQRPPPVAKAEHPAILRWNWSREWPGSAAMAFDDEVRQLIESGRSDNHPLIDYIGPLVERP